jgi:NADH:ubiquinone oxidoreductase subunit C
MENLLSLKTSYYYIFLQSLMLKFINGFIVKPTQLYLSIDSYNLMYVMTFIKLNFICLFTSLLDIAVVDYPENSNKRFELNYVFINYIYEYRLIVKIYNNGILPVTSLEHLYLSSN